MTQPTNRQPARWLPSHLYWCAYYSHEQRWHILASRENCLSWGGERLLVVNAQDAEYVRRTGKLPESTARP